MIVRLKEGVSLDNVHMEMFRVIWRVARIWSDYGASELWVVGGREQGHVTDPDPRRQFHWLPDGTCQAIDIRTWNIPSAHGRHRATSDLKTMLGEQYDVFYERPGKKGEHCHIQYDPERPGTR